MALGDAQTRAIWKAIRSNGAALVERERHGVYRVPSATRAGVTYTVTGNGPFVGDYTCTCPSGSLRAPCWHAAAVRLRKTQEDALAQWRAIRDREAAATAFPVPTRAA